MKILGYAGGCLLIGALWVAGQCLAAAAQEWGPEEGSGEAARAMRQVLKTRFGMDPDSIDTRLLAAATVDKLDLTRTKDLKTIEPERMLRDFDCYKDIKAAIDSAKLAAPVKELLRKKYGWAILWPQRQGAPYVGVEAECAVVRGLPDKTGVVRLSGEAPLRSALREAYPGFGALNALQQHLVIRHLDELNHNIRLEFSVRCRPDEVAERLPKHLGVDLADIALDRWLFKIDPGLKPKGYDKGADPVAHHSLPLGDGTVRLWCYRIRPDGDILMPPADYLAARASPDPLDVSNLWLTDARLIASQRPRTLILSGNDIADLGVLSKMKSLEHLALQSLPVKDLGPLKGLRLKSIDLRDTPVVDLAPLRGMPLEKVLLDRTRVSDLGPLSGSPVRHLQIWDTAVTDLRPLKDMPLTYLELRIGVAYESAGLDIVRTKSTLTELSDHRKAAWFKAYEIRHSRDLLPLMRGRLEHVGPVNRVRYGLAPESKEKGKQ